MLRKHVEDFGWQWDRYPPGHLRTYHNSPHQSTDERSSFLVFGVDCHSPSEDSLMPPSVAKPRKFDDCREELVPSLSTARSNAVPCIKTAHVKYKKSYYHTAREAQLRVRQWILVRFPCKETGKNRNPIMARTRLSFINLMSLLPRSTILIRNPSRYTSRECGPVSPPLSSRILLVRWTPTKSRTSPQWDWLSGA